MPARADSLGSEDEGITHADVSAVLVQEEQDLGDLGQRTPQRQHPWTSSASLATRHSIDGETLEGSHHDHFAQLTPQRDYIGDVRPRQYDAEGRARGPLGIITRSPTIRHVSQTIRNASARVANIIASEKDDYAGMTRLPTRDEDATPVESPIEQPKPPDLDYESPRSHVPLPRQEGLRGRTLCMFTAGNPIRVACDRVLRFW